MLKTFYPEMAEKKPEAKIEATPAYYGKHYFLRTRLELKGQGITLEGIQTAESLVPQAQHRIGERKYKVTNNAFKRLQKQYDIALPILLD